ncbi:MAG: TlpA disulfide reductase family protein [Thermodesulfobacteriota bacterium]
MGRAHPTRLLHFWATWCAPCRKEMPSLDGLGRELRGRGLEIIAVAEDRGWWSRGRVEKFVKRHGLTFTVLLDPGGKVREDYEVRSLPTTYIIGRDGGFAGKAAGERDWNGEALRKLIEGLLGRWP